MRAILPAVLSIESALTAQTVSAKKSFLLDIKSRQHIGFSRIVIILRFFQVIVRRQKTRARLPPEKRIVYGYDINRLHDFSRPAIYHQPGL
jgi:hypothetical protein